MAVGPAPADENGYPILNVNGVVYDRFPPSGFEQHHTMSWIYMPLILQAANNGIPVIDMTLPADLQAILDGFVGRLHNSPSFPQLGVLYQMFDQPYHLPSLIQNAILAEADSTLGTEFEEFIHQIYISWASDEY